MTIKIELKNWKHYFLTLIFQVEKNIQRTGFEKINTTFLEYNFPLPLESISFEMSIKIMIWKHRRQHQKINGFITTHINAQIIEISWILLTDKKPSSFRNSVFFLVRAYLLKWLMPLKRVNKIDFYCSLNVMKWF